MDFYDLIMYLIIKFDLKTEDNYNKENFNLLIRRMRCDLFFKAYDSIRQRNHGQDANNFMNQLDEENLVTLFIECCEHETPENKAKDVFLKLLD